jgi:ribonuclease P protein component
VGNSVARNRIKRAVREWFRQNRSDLEEAMDMVVIARQRAARLSATEIAKVLNQLMFSRNVSKR